jgi:hypothetical protein
MVQLGSVKGSQSKTVGFNRVGPLRRAAISGSCDKSGKLGMGQSSPSFGTQ